MRGFLDRVVFLFSVVCGVNRLARFHVTREELAEKEFKLSLCRERV